MAPGPLMFASSLWWTVYHPDDSFDPEKERNQMRGAAMILGLAFTVVAISYWLLPAGSLPDFFPGFEAGSSRVHVKHAIAAAVAAVSMFAIGWYLGRSRA
jgi:hypothetical protein